MDTLTMFKNDFTHCCVCFIDGTTIHTLYRKRDHREPLLPTTPKQHRGIKDTVKWTKKLWLWIVNYFITISFKQSPAAVSQ